MSETKICPICNEDLWLFEFGVSRARQDGRNLYCKACVNARVTRQRDTARRFRNQRTGVIAFPAGISLMAQRVLRAIESGAHTQRAIQMALRGQIKLDYADQEVPDLISDKLAELMLDYELVHFEGEDAARVYLPGAKAA